METLKRLVSSLKERIPDSGALFNPGVEESELDNLEKATGITLPEEFRALYRSHNGEGEGLSGFWAGFGWMKLEAVLGEWRGLQQSAYTIVSDKPGQIREGAFQTGWIPFGDDGGGSFLVMDLAPGPEGSYGQIITIDHNSDISYVIAGSLSELFAFIEKGLSSGDLTISQEEDEAAMVLTWKEGHLFDDVQALTGTAAGSGAIEVDGYWADFFQNDLADGKVPLQTLAKITMVFIKKDASEKFGEIPLDLLKHMVNLKELIIHAGNIAGFEPLREISSLAKLVIGSASFSEADLRFLEAGTFKQLTLANVSLRDLSPLGNLKSLKTLRLYNMSLLDCTSISKLTNLTELSITKMEGVDLSCLSALTKLSVLELDRLDIPNLDFLRNLKKLKRFKTDRKARDESTVEVFCGMSKLQELNYPISDMQLAGRCPQLTEINVDAEGFRHAEALKTSSIRSAMVYNAACEEEAERIIAEIEQYCKLQTSGWEQSWVD
ncbi:MAG: cell wall assembly/cell proliferation coordinating protein [Paenibacillaceae bacterium]|jgi:internalin A|nr:cell wall assembly/cell proliferation coordinating protein [Paenibacillaceae bacterium]